MIKKACDIKLNVRPILLGMEHRYFYEGPCRFGKGEALEVGYDKIANEQLFDAFLTDVTNCLPEGAVLMEPVRVKRTDNWENKEQFFEDIRVGVQDADVVFFFSNIALDDIDVEFAERFPDVPMMIGPKSYFSGTSIYAAVKAVNPDKEIYIPINWTEAGEILAAMRARKVIRNTNILLASRFNSDVSYSSVDTFANHEKVTKNLGVHFRYINAHELLDDLSPAVPEGNHTTPGRQTWNITEEELAEAEKIADELIGGAKEVEVERKYVVNSVKAYILVRKMMDEKDCNGFTIPCPDVCSTRRINNLQFTFCMTHSLNMESGIPSSCEFDADSVLSQQTLIAVSGQRPYMGNTNPIPYDNGELIQIFGLTEERLAALKKEDPKNLYFMQHAVPHRCFRSPSEKGEYALRHFAYEQGFGAVFRYDFEQDKGQVITLCRYSPDGSKMFIGKGEIVGGDGYDLNNCNGLVIFRVKDQQDFWDKQKWAGNHVALVYGDYTKELSRLCSIMGLEELGSY